MIPRADYRAVIWVLLYFVAVWWQVRSAYTHSQAAYDAGDLSAFAWTGFLPFLMPLFMFDAALYVVPSVIVVELVLFWVRYRRIL